MCPAHLCSLRRLRRADSFERIALEFFRGRRRLAGQGLFEPGARREQRLPVVVGDEHSFVSKPFAVASTSIALSEARDFQFYYRETAAGGALFNLSDGLSVVFCP